MNYLYKTNESRSVVVRNKHENLSKKIVVMSSYNNE